MYNRISVKRLESESDYYKGKYVLYKTCVPVDILNTEEPHITVYRGGNFKWMSSEVPGSILIFPALFKI